MTDDGLPEDDPTDGLDLSFDGAEDILRSWRRGIESGETPEWQRLADRLEAFPAQIPEGGLFLTAGADVQKDRIEVDVWAWGRDRTSWLVDHIVIPGGPDDPACWDRLTALLGQTWVHENGAVMPIARLAIDTGYESAAVHAWARQQGIAQVAPIKGLEGFNRATPVSGPTFVDATVNGRKLKRGARLWTVASATFKAETYRFLRLERPSDEERGSGVPDAAGTIHLPDWIDTEWLKQLVAKQLVTIRNKRGYARQEWQKMRERNEALDCRVYARAAAWILGADRWDEATWRRLEAQAGVETRPVPQPAIPAEPSTATAPRAGTPTTLRRKRRAYALNGFIMLMELSGLIGPLLVATPSLLGLSQVLQHLKIAAEASADTAEAMQAAQARRLSADAATSRAARDHQFAADARDILDEALRRAQERGDLSPAPSRVN